MSSQNLPHSSLLKLVRAELKLLDYFKFFLTKLWINLFPSGVHLSNSRGRRSSGLTSSSATIGHPEDLVVPVSKIISVHWRLRWEIERVGLKCWWQRQRVYLSFDRLAEIDVEASHPARSSPAPARASAACHAVNSALMAGSIECSCFSIVQPPTAMRHARTSLS